MARLDEIPDEAEASSSRESRRTRRRKKKQPSAIPLANPSTVRQQESPKDEEEDEDEGEYDDSDEDDPDLPVESIESMLRHRAHQRAEDPPGEREDEWFNMFIMTVPFIFLFILLDILVHMQYNHRAKSPEVASRVFRAAPVLAVIVFYTNRHSEHWATRSALLTACVWAGCRLIWLMNKASWSVVTAQAPPMGTLWVLSVVQLPLSRCVVGLAAVGGWAWYSGMKLAP